MSQNETHSMAKQSPDLLWKSFSTYSQAHYEVAKTAAQLSTSNASKEADDGIGALRILEIIPFRNETVALIWSTHELVGWHKARNKVLIETAIYSLQNTERPAQSRVFISEYKNFADLIQFLEWVGDQNGVVIDLIINKFQEHGFQVFTALIQPPTFAELKQWGCLELPVVGDYARYLD